MMKRNLLLLLGVVVLATVPLLIHVPKEDEEIFAGADGQATEAIKQSHPDYQSWYSNFWEPPSAEIESMLFALQAAIGAGIVCYILGYYQGRHTRAKESTKNASG